MTRTNTLARSLHDVGLAAWFGGSLMGAIGLNGAAGAVERPGERAKVANAGWARWTPVNLAAIAAHVGGEALLISANKDQRDAGSAAKLKTALTIAAIGATVYSRKLGRTLLDAGARADVTGAQRRLKTLQWAVPALTGAALALNTRVGAEQGRADGPEKGLGRLKPTR